MSTADQRHWLAPDEEAKSEVVRLYNSAVDEKVPFVPLNGSNSKNISWYTCGPTVYDVSHLGHARNYVTFDIVRRVLEDYFGYNILYVMNITDVDDKIIMRARHNHLFDKFMLEQKLSTKELLETAGVAIGEALPKQASKVEKADAAAQVAKGGTDSRKAKALQEAVEGEQLKLKKIKETQEQINAWLAEGSTAPESVIVKAVKDVISQKLDAEFGDAVTDKSIYKAHGAKYEAEFLDDMKRLGVREPDIMTRVTDYMDEIVAFVKTIVANGLAYEAAGSVYFDVRAFKQRGHTYGKLKPWAVGSAELASEGESNFATDEKRSDQDFALWKASKPGEPSWESEWGSGRPGWHIECSAMAHAVLGKRMDIHSGGEDLKFPHHDNELAQSEAFMHGGASSCSKCGTCQQWVNYFLHSGHLAIDGLKMSKSLKNFITIREALEEFSARQIRLLFCLQPWHKAMTFNNASRQEMVTKEATLKNFFQNIQVALRENAIADVSTAKSDADMAFLNSIVSCEAEVHAALLDNIDTATSMACLLDLVTTTNKYLSDREAQSAPPSPLLLTKAARYVTRILSVFGLSEGQGDRLAFTSDAAATSGGDDSAPVLDAFAAFRDSLRDLALDPSADLKKQLMQMCDSLRDKTMVDLGIRLEDKPGRSVWKRDDPEAIRADIAEKRRAQSEAALKKAEMKMEQKRVELEKVNAVAAFPTAQARLADRYKFDGDGAPTHAKVDSDWVELDAKGCKAAGKVLEKEKKARAPTEKKLSQNPSLVDTLTKELTELTAAAADLS